MKYWERIRKERTDITDYVIHWTRGRVEGGVFMKPLDVLMKIIECGYLIAGFSTKPSIYDRTGRPTVRGPEPAVCFTEQSLEHFSQSCRILPSHYQPYGVALYKRALYEYGGRPVIYNSEEMLGQMFRPGEQGYAEGKEVYRGGLPEDYQYLWVRYQPLPNVDGYVVDWTHEREWRSKVTIFNDVELGKTPSDGVPILLPAVYDNGRHKHIRYLPKILVSSVDEIQLVSELIKARSPEWSANCDNKYLQGYFRLLTRVNIVCLNALPEQPEGRKLEWVVPQPSPRGAAEA